MTAHPPVRDLIPHSGQFVLLDRVLSWSPGSIVAELTLTPDKLFADRGGTDALVSMEFMAQAVAACLGYEAFRGGEGVRVGMIIAAKKFTLHTRSFPTGSRLTICADRIRGNEDLSHFCCETRIDDEIASTAVLTLYHAPGVVGAPARAT